MLGVMNRWKSTIHVGVITIMTIDEGPRVSNVIIDRMKGLGARTDEMTIEMTIDQGNGEIQMIKAHLNVGNVMGKDTSLWTECLN